MNNIDDRASMFQTIGRCIQILSPIMDLGISASQHCGHVVGRYIIKSSKKLHPSSGYC